MSTASKPNVEPRDEVDSPSTVGVSFQGISSQDGEFPREAQASLERLLACHSINRAPRIRAVLKFMIEALLEGRARTINEHMVGEAVFGRPPGYNPGEDNIVRVTIRHLRDRIEEYYRTDGRDEKYVFKIPKGKYVPVLSSRQAEQDEGLASSADLQGPLAIATSEQPSGLTAATGETHFPRGILFGLSWVLVGLLAATVAVLGFRLHSQANTETRRTPRDVGLLSLLLTNGKPTTIVVTDSNLEAYRMMFRKTVPLDAYLDSSYLFPASDSSKNALIQRAWSYVESAPETSVTCTIITSEIQAASSPAQVSIKYPHALSMREIEHGNYIFLGGPWIDPWEQLFESHLNFRILPPPNAPWASSIHNMNPVGSEPAIFAQHKEGSSTVSYVRFVLLRNVINDGYTVLLSGTDDEAIEAGAQFLTSGSTMNILLRDFKVVSPENLPSMEVVIETTGLQDVPENFRVVAERVVKTQ